MGHPKYEERARPRQVRGKHAVPLREREMFELLSVCEGASFASQNGRGIEARGAAEWECAAEECDRGGENQDYAEDQQRGLGWYAENSCAEETRK